MNKCKQNKMYASLLVRHSYNTNYEDIYVK